MVIVFTFRWKRRRSYRKCHHLTITGKGKCPYTTFSFRLAQSNQVARKGFLTARKNRSSWDGTCICGACYFAGFFWFCGHGPAEDYAFSRPQETCQNNFCSNNSISFLRAAKMPVLQLGTKCAAALRPEQLRKQDLAGCRDHHLHLLRYYLTLA